MMGEARYRHRDTIIAAKKKVAALTAELDAAKKAAKRSAKA